MQFLKANTAVDVLIGPFLDSTDGDTEETALTLSQADIKLSKNGQTMAQKSDATAAAHDANGMYNCELDATDTNTEGTLVLYCHETGALAVRHECMVLSEAAYDSLCVAKDTGYMDVNVKAISESTGAADFLQALNDLGLESTVDNSGADVSTTIFKTDLTQTQDDGINNHTLVFTGGVTAALFMQGGPITNYDGTTKEITIASPLSVAPADNEPFVII